MITPSFNLTATERVLPKLALDFTTASLDSRITFTRTTNASNPATYVGSNGYVTAATNNQPRFDYNPVALTCKGLLIEESRANLLLNSETLTSWTKTRSSTAISSPAVLAPDNTTTAYKLTEDTTASATHQMSTAVSPASANPRAYSFFAREAGRYIFTVARTNAPIVSFTHTFNLSTGTATGGGTIEAFPNGWYRCSGVYTTTLSTQEGVVIRLADASGNTTYTGDGASGLYIWGTQIEDGSFATSYIPTTTTALTRNADVAVMTGTNFSDWFNATEGALTVWFDTNATGQGGVFSINNGSSTQRIDYRSGAASGFVFINGNSAMFLGSPTKGVLRKACVAIKNASFAGQVTNGTFRTASDAIPTGLSTLNIGSLDSAANFVNGHIAKIFYYPQRLINAEVQAQVRI